MRYSLLMNAPEPAPREISDEVMASFQTAFDTYGKAMHSAGVLLGAEILQPSALTTTVTTRKGRLQVQDGPFADTKEMLAGIFVIDVPDLDAALAWAEKCPGAQYGVIEVRPSAIHFAEGQWKN